MTSLGLNTFFHMFLSRINEHQHGFIGFLSQFRVGNAVKCASSALDANPQQGANGKTAEKYGNQRRFQMDDASDAQKQNESDRREHVYLYVCRNDIVPSDCPNPEFRHSLAGFSGGIVFHSGLLSFLPFRECPLLK
jgi:hypothetical protein